MPLKSYGVLAGRVLDRRREGGSNTPHYQILLADDAGTRHRVAVNVRSQEHPSELLYLDHQDFQHPVTALLPPTPVGWTLLGPGRGEARLDFIRGNLFDPALMRPLPPDLPGEDNDLADRLDSEVQRAIDDRDVIAYAFGERWGPEPGLPDKVFGFSPGSGVHDIHMNQGNSDRFKGDDGVWQDGALLLHFRPAARWVAFFLAFQSQAWHTDDETGHALPAGPSPDDQPVRILAALVNATGPAPEAETVTLLNATPGPVDLGGWRLADGHQHALTLPPGILAAGATVVVALHDGVQLGNEGGTISLLDREGRKVHGVSYTAAQVRREGWTITF